MYDKKIKVTIIIDVDTWKEKEQKILLLEFFKNFDVDSLKIEEYEQW